MREGKTRHNAANRCARYEEEGKDVHSVGILCEKVVLLHIQLLIENNGAINEIELLVSLGKIVEEGIPYLPL